MSFSFIAGDFVRTARLAYSLYKHCYRASRDAPQEFKLLVTELGALKASIEFLADEAKDPESTLASGGERRVQLVSELLERILGTLMALQRHAERSGKLESSRPSLKRAWARFKWSIDGSDLDVVRNQVCLTVLIKILRYDTLCLTLHSWFITMG